MNGSREDFWWQHVTRQYGGKPADTAIYLKLIEHFSLTGKIAGRGEAWPEDEPWREQDDPLLRFLNALMSDDGIRSRVLSNRLCAKVFLTSVGRFVADSVHHQAFLAQSVHVEAARMAEAERRSPMAGAERQWWQELIGQIGQHHDSDGFDRDYFLRMFSGHIGPEQTDKLLYDWALAVSENLRQKEQKYVATMGEILSGNLPKLLDNAAQAMKKNAVSERKAVQSWQMMDGRWTETEFERHLNIVRMQDRYPQLQQVADRMGRVSAANGTDRLTVQQGKRAQLSHSSGSDIAGITTGSDLGSLLPIELAMYSDSDMEDIFYYRYTRHRLQTFDYRSRLTSPSRRLSFRHARRLGPMIVCIDTSASMYGPPQRIIQSLLAILEEMAERLHRDCFLIDFSVSIRTIDLRQRLRDKFYTSIGLSHDEAMFARGHLPFIGGGTDSRGMLAATFSLLQSDESYINADVLWISDFLIPLPPQSELAKIKAFRSTGTRFYGLCIRPQGETATEWAPVFDHIYNVEYRIVRRY